MLRLHDKDGVAYQGGGGRSVDMNITYRNDSDDILESLQHEDTPLALLVRAMDSDKATWREAAARHPRATKDLLYQAFGDKSWFVRAAVVRREDAPEDLVRAARHDPCQIIREIALERAKGEVSQCFKISA